MTKLPIVLILVLLLTACMSGECRRKDKVPPLPGSQKKDSSVAVITSGAAVVPLEARRVLVYKYDGSLQCGGGQPRSVKDMQKDLGNIKVFSAVKKPDGLMHIQVCGANTGLANVYEILAKDLERAKKSGFKQWKFE